MRSRDVRVMGMMRARVVIAGLALAAMALPAGAIGTTLHPSVIDSVGDVGEEPSVAIGTDGNPVISYHDATNDTLKVAWCNDPACAGGDETTTTIDATSGAGQFSAIAIGADGYPVIAYSIFGWNLMLAKCNDRACTGGDETISTVDASGGQPGPYPSIAIGTDGNPVISYLANQTADLRVAACNDPACSGWDETISVVDDTGTTVGVRSSIAIGTDGNPVIAHYDLTNQDLRFVRCDDRACAPGGDTAVVVDATGDSGWYPSMVIGADGNPLITYRRTVYPGPPESSGLVAAHCGDASCSTVSHRILDSGGSGSAVALDADRLPLIAYRTGDLVRLAHCDEADCGSGASLDTVDTTGSPSWEKVALAVAADGTPVVAYDHHTDGDLRVAANNARVSVPGTLDLGSRAIDAGPGTPLTVTVSSTGSTPLSVGTPAVQGASADAFRITGGTCAGQAVPAAGTCTIEVAFDPVAVGSAAAQLTIPSDDPTATAAVALTGVGAPAAPPPTPSEPAPSEPAPAMRPPALSGLRVVGSGSQARLLLRVSSGTRRATIVFTRPRPRSRALTRRLAACARRSSPALRTRCRSAARRQTIARRSGPVRAGRVVLRLAGVPAGRHLATINLTGRGTRRSVSRYVRVS
ncbi:MAG: choice-of-anchor D domain-containing protein [Actinobacteria bacterium]|nr:choice-of-anchor D domain-containing protein [Thermoleophilia bacterium]MCB9010374.1 choice-of-anchor D domain-containing protein [Actinomycetota bacterium]